MARGSTDDRPPPLITLRILLWKGRGAMLVGTLVVAGWAVVQQLAPSGPTTAPVVVTTREVPRGEVLEAGDLRVAHLPARLAPEGALGDATALVGRATAVGLTAGLPVVDPLLEGARFGVEPPPGTVVVPVRLADASVVGLLRAGDRVDLVGPAESGPVLGMATGAEDTGSPLPQPVLLAQGAVVLDLGGGTEEEGRLGLGGVAGATSTSEAAAVTVVAVSPEEGRALAATGSWTALGAVLVD
ncbi:flagellar biosynthesis protein FlgA [Actinotalea sp. BY-33]|uniref:Flagellar biosynthesis protein FlgA n=1 Tax=Actinotalea soli TaxID=2819234 RepID=A0A939RWB7_9CELL|nr:SAF domain-containing protein [Actinotalea soli]MBO1752021.1 flagellar biosynthesis protein FlgA [Actinotalea soli]